MKVRLTQLARNWNNSFQLLQFGIALAVLHLGPPLVGGEQEFTVDEFNQLPREFRIGYLKSGPSKRKLGPKAKVDDLIDELLLEAGNADEAKKKRGVAFALLAVRETPHSSDQVIESCKKIADDLIESSYSRAAVEVYYELLGNESLPYLIDAIEHDDTATQIQAAKRLGHNIGTLETIPKLKATIEREESEGSDTVAKYLREAVKLIEEREAGKRSGEAQKGQVPQADAGNDSGYPGSTSDADKPGGKSGNTTKLSLPLVGVLGGLIAASVLIAARKRKT